RQGPALASSAQFDALGRATEITEGEGSKVYTTRLVHDEAGNLVSLTAPGLAAETLTWDARGRLTERTKPDGGTLRFTWDALGNLTRYSDEAGKAIDYAIDALGRVERVTYADGTFEETRYEPVTGLVAAEQNRAGKWLSYVYDAGGRVTEVHLGESAEGSPLFERYSYDAAGRLTKRANADAATELGDFDLLGRPGVTRTSRYAGRSGLSGEPVLVDVHTQGHVWSVFDGERSRWRMPVAGDALPASESGSAWRTWIDEERDAAGNLAAQRAVVTREGPAAGELIAESTARGIGRLASRRRMLEGGLGALDTAYDYADGFAGGVIDDLVIPPSPPGVASGLLGRAATSLGGLTLGGSEILRDASKRTSHARHLGLSDRESSFRYDARGRLEHSSLFRMPAASAEPAVADSYSAADFRSARGVSGRLTPTQRATLGEAARAVEPAGWSAAGNAAHQIERRTLTLEGLPEDVRDYVLSGGRRESDGVWVAGYDPRDRLTSLSSESLGRRFEYVYDPGNRVVGRTAYRRDGTSWTLEDRTSALARDGLPAETTFVWDPVADRLVAIFGAGKSTESATPSPESGLLRQVVHGDQAYDDPLEVLIADSFGNPKRYLPVFDEAAGGSLVAVTDERGALVQRVFYADAYGDAPRYQHGPIADRITIGAEKGSSGELQRVLFRVHLTDAVDEETVKLEGGVPTGIRLEVIDDAVVDGAPVVRVAPGTPSLESPDTIVWELSGAQWADITTTPGVKALRIALTNQLRAHGWGETPVSPAPPWMETLYGVTASAALPVSKTESLAALTAILASIEPGTPNVLFEVADLYLAASPDPKVNLLTGWKAAPFIEGDAGLVYLRERWMSTGDGQFLTADPLGPVDSSNLQAYADSAATRGDLSRECARPVNSHPCFAMDIAVTAPKSSLLEYGLFVLGEFAKEGPSALTFFSLPSDEQWTLLKKQQSIREFHSRTRIGIVPIGFGNVGIPGAAGGVASAVVESAAMRPTLPGPGPGFSRYVAAEKSITSTPRPQRLLLAAGESTRTIEQVANLRGTNYERGNAFNEHLAQARMGKQEVSATTRLGKRIHDVGDIRGLQTDLRIEGKNYRRFLTIGGQIVHREVPLTVEMRLQVYKDVLFVRAGRALGVDRLVQWEFAGAPPTRALAEFLQHWRIPYVHY
ncbi:MAG TPA: hypothetical protein VMT00_04450, partial [Thermoanaerobaculia bacterium]|nr:hypothetical protein [Thermoanaerobaculia bacterium]